ncbi:LysR family transcriptional regulator [Paenibacillus chungangensis]|uniref:LysR family transcriptional regulator n=1 Tax=Paenibacillus chungangensis TaxID=696535 RepID=A0ABW3HKW5_9BACL
MIQMEWYRMFLYTARKGNLTKAAEELLITQPSVSYGIKQMEEALGLRLFHRLSKGVQLTEEGRALLPYVEQAFSLLEAAERHANDLKRLEEGEIRIGASDSLIKHMLLPQLNQFHQEHPGIRIRLSHGKTPDIARRLKDGAIDCAIVHMPLNDTQLHIEPLAELEDCFVVGSRYRTYAGRMLSTEELAKLPLLFLSPGSSTRTHVESWFAAQGRAVKPDMELGSVDLLAEFAGQGYGAAFITRSFVDEELRSGKLFRLQLEQPLPSRGIGLAVRRDTALPLAAERFIEMLRSGPSL